MMPVAIHGEVVSRKRKEGRDRFQAISIPCNETSEATRLVGELADRHGLGTASHLSWAARSGTGNSIAEAKSDGGESGAGNCILDVMRKKGVANRLVLVARWYGGRHLGPRRFRIYRGLAMEVSNPSGGTTP